MNLHLQSLITCVWYYENRHEKLPDKWTTGEESDTSEEGSLVGYGVGSCVGLKKIIIKTNKKHFKI